MKVDPERAEFRCTTLAMLIGYAYRLSPDRVSGPDWMMTVGTPRYNIAATMPSGVLRTQAPEMMKALLAERFHLAVHRGKNEQAVYALVPARGGPRVRVASAGPPDDEPDTTSDGFYGTVQSRNTDGATILSNPRMGTVRQTGDPYQVQRWEAASTSFAGLADLIDHVAPFSLPVVDMSGLGGRYQLVLEVSLKDLAGRRVGGPDDHDEAVRTAFNDGLAKLGLRLERRKAAVEILVVDRVDKTPTEN
jgi:uncharacterized protein (TIGR03435 family)